MSSSPPFSRVLIANRGEIAIRIAHSLREMGIEPIMVHSNVDADAPHVTAGNLAYNLGGHDAGSSYLQVPQLLDAAFELEAEAVHPGYGFLSEDADFARGLTAVGLVFIGPDADHMEVLGSKQHAKEAAIAAGVPVVPGYHKDDGDDQHMLVEAEKLGFPLLIKAAGGGGGKGMRLVERKEDFLEAIAACRREAKLAFRYHDMLLEKRIHPARHVEIQIMGDQQGNVITLNERDCSIQRRHQKIIEEAPAPGVSPELRQAMSEAAAKLARHVGYYNAGTVEFLLDENGNFFFLEMNTRLQVEHPVTELITGLDLVQVQVRVAAGESLPDILGDRDLSPRGHAIEARIYAEVPEQDYLPSAGTLRRVIEPSGPFVRVDSGVHEGVEVSVHWDPMLSKIIVHGQDRETARHRMLKTLKETAYLGIGSNVDFLQRVLASDGFRDAQLRTDFLELHPELTKGPAGPPGDAAYVGAMLCQAMETGMVAKGNAQASVADVFSSLGAFRLWEGK